MKKPSKRPCCFALRNFVSFSAPLRTRSSLHSKSASYEHEFFRVDVLEPLLFHEELHEAVHVRVSPLKFDLVGRFDVWLQEYFLRLFPGPLLWDCNAALPFGFWSLLLLLLLLLVLLRLLTVFVIIGNDSGLLGGSL